MKKRIEKIMVLLLSIACLFLCSCKEEEEANHNLTVNCIIENTETSLVSSYDLFCGERKQTFSIDKETTVYFDITTLSGELSVSLSREGCPADYQGKGIPTSSFSVTLSEKGQYTICIEAKNHKGGYRIDWGEPTEG